LVRYKPYFLYIWVPPETEVEPQFLKSNFHLLLKAFSLTFTNKNQEEKNYWKKISKQPANLKILPTIANHL
jgi:hypothetical protein